MHSERGFIALMSVIIISAMLLVLIVTLEASSFFSRFDAVESEYKRQSLAYAEACVSAALLRTAQGTSISTQLNCNLSGTCSGGLSPAVCAICLVVNDGTLATTTVRAAYNGAYTNLTVVASSSVGTFGITKWSESGSGDPVTCPAP